MLITIDRRTDKTRKNAVIIDLIFDDGRVQARYPILRFEQARILYEEYQRICRHPSLSSGTESLPCWGEQETRLRKQYESITGRKGAIAA